MLIAIDTATRPGGEAPGGGTTYPEEVLQSGWNPDLPRLQRALARAAARDSETWVELAYQFGRSPAAA